MRRIFALICAITLFPGVVQAGSARAQTTESGPETTSAPVAATDEVRLHDGSFVRGSVEELERGSHVVIIKSDGTRRRIEWADVEAVDLARDREKAPAAEPAAEPIPTTPPADDSVTLGAGYVRFHMVLEGPRGEMATLYRQTGTAVAWGPAGTATAESSAVVCTYPCGTAVPTTAGTYHINRAIDGPILRSKPFSLAGRGSDVTAYVKPGNRGKMMVGMLLVVFGGTLAITGPLVLGLAAGSDSFGGSKGVAAGAAMTASGIVGLAAGIPLMILGRNRVRLENGPPP